MKNLLVMLILMLPSISLASADDDGICLLSDSLQCGSATQISKIGVLGETYTAYTYVHVFGQAMRAANRIVLVGPDRELAGIYAVNDFPKDIQNNCLVFSYESQFGNMLCLTNGDVPEKVYLDAQVLNVFK